MEKARTPALVLALLLGLFGMFVGGLMTWHHETQLYAPDAQQGALIGCEESEGINCDIVNTSAWSEVLGVPLGTWAIPFYGTVVVLAGLGLKRREVRAPLVAMGLGAGLFSAFLYHISTTELHYVCAWCLRLYATNAGILVAGVLGGASWALEGSVLGPAAGTYALLALVGILGQKGYRHSLTGDADPTIVAAGATLTHDPKGDAPTRTFTVTTEDNKQASFSLDPDDAWSGKADAKVAVVMFGDFECGYCKRSSAELGRLYEKYSDRVLFVFKHFPMNPDCNSGVNNKKHKSACQAAFASVCAQDQGYFWSFHDLVYKNQHRLDNDALRTYATEVGADGTRFDACMSSLKTTARVSHDAEVGSSLDIHGTPRIFIDGKLYRSGTSAEMMAKAIELALGASPEDAASRAGALPNTDTPIVPIPVDVKPMQSLSIGGLAFRMDTFEAGITDGKATAGKHQIPSIRTTWFEAKAACEGAGKRMCTEEEWVSACQSARALDDNHNGELADDQIEGTAYPYGDYHIPGRCWDGHEGDEFRPVYTGEMPGCVTPGGVYDLTGNVDEWVGDSAGHATLLGGAWDTTEDHARCYRRNDTFGPGYGTSRTGFRCCANP